MNRISLAFGIAAFAAIAAPLSAQGRGRNSQGIPPGQMPPAGMCRIWIDGVPPGHQPRPTDCATAEARVPVNGRVIYGDNSGYGSVYGNSTNGGKYGRNGGVYNGRGQVNTNCAWYDINCTGVNGRNGGGWYQVGSDRYGNVIYERRVTDRNGNTVIQTARQDSRGRLQVINTRQVNSRDNGRYDKRGNRREDDNDDDDSNGGYNGGHNGTHRGR